MGYKIQYLASPLLRKESIRIFHREKASEQHSTHFLLFKSILYASCLYLAVSIFSQEFRLFDMFYYPGEDACALPLAYGLNGSCIEACW